MKHVGTTTDGNQLVEMTAEETAGLLAAVEAIGQALNSLGALLQVPGSAAPAREPAPRTKPVAAVKSVKPKARRAAPNGTRPPIVRKGKISWAAMLTEALLSAGKPQSIDEIYKRIHRRKELQGVARVRDRLSINLASQPKRFRRVSPGVYTLVDQPQQPAATSTGRHTPGNNDDEEKRLLAALPADLTTSELERRLDICRRRDIQDPDARRDLVARTARRSA